MTFSIRGLFLVLFLVFAVLKLCHVINWNWWLIASFLAIHLIIKIPTVIEIWRK